MSSTANDGVPDEEIWIRNSIEQLKSIVHGARKGDGGAEDELAQGGGVGEEATDDHKTMDLLERTKAPAPVPYPRPVSLVARLPDHLLCRAVSEREPSRLNTNTKERILMQGQEKLYFSFMVCTKLPSSHL